MKYVIGGFLFMWGWMLLRAAVEAHRAKGENFGDCAKPGRPGTAGVPGNGARNYEEQSPKLFLAGRNAPSRRSLPGFTCGLQRHDLTTPTVKLFRASDPAPSRALVGGLLLGGSLRRF